MNRGELHDAGDCVPHEGAADFIRHNSDAPPVSVPRGYVGPVYIPSTGRMVWWTGRVAIGLRHQAVAHGDEVLSQSASWLQRVVLSRYWRPRMAS